LFESGGDRGARLGIVLSELAAERSEGTAAPAAGGGFTDIPLWASQDNSGITLRNWKPSLAPFSPTFGGWTQSDVMAMQNVYLEYNGVWIDLDSMSASY
jgi:hypothetical protein